MRGYATISPLRRTMNQAANTFAKELKALGSTARAENEKRYHKSKRVHWGVSAPLTDSLIREYTSRLGENKLLEMAKELWATDVFDLMTSAERILADKKIRPSKNLWSLIKKWMKAVDGWGLEDNLARVAWKCIAADEKFLDDLEEWTDHKNFWYRRAALVFTLPYAKPDKNPERMLAWAAKYVDDREWFIQKAIGWWLRDLGKHNPHRVIAFLEPHWHRLMYVAKKESTRKLDKKLLKGLMMKKAV